MLPPAQTGMKQQSTGQTRGAVAEVGDLNYMYYIISQFYE